MGESFSKDAGFHEPIQESTVKLAKTKQNSQSFQITL